MLNDIQPMSLVSLMTDIGVMNGFSTEESTLVGSLKSLVSRSMGSCSTVKSKLHLMAFEDADVSELNSIASPKEGVSELERTVGWKERVNLKENNI